MTRKGRMIKSRLYRDLPPHRDEAGKTREGRASLDLALDDHQPVRVAVGPDVVVREVDDNPVARDRSASEYPRRAPRRRRAPAPTPCDASRRRRDVSVPAPAPLVVIRGQDGDADPAEEVGVLVAPRPCDDARLDDVPLELHV